MSNAAEILNFDFNYTHFLNVGLRIIEEETERKLVKHKKRLSDIVTANSFSGTNVSNFDVRKIYELFIENNLHGIDELKKHFDSKIKVRRLCSSLNYPERSEKNIIRSDSFNKAFQLIIEKFKNNWTFNLLDCLYKNWEGTSSYNKNLVLNYLNESISNYEGKNKFVSYLKTHSKLFLDSDSPQFLASDLLFNNRKLSNLVQYYFLPEHWIKTEYFGVVADYYTTSVLRKHDGQLELSIDDIILFLKKHENIETTKKCISSIINKLENSSDDYLKDKIRTLSLNMIGDPADDYKWIPWDDKIESKDKINRAKTILNGWINKEIVELFFHKVSMDRDRKQFWLNYYKHATKLKIFGNLELNRSLQTDSRISPFLNHRFGHLQNAGNDNALVFLIKSYVFVEFSKKGTAFYAYKDNNRICPDFKKRRIFKSELIQPNKSDLLLRKSGNAIWDTKPEGRFTHFEGWQPILAKWIRKYLSI